MFTFLCIGIFIFFRYTCNYNFSKLFKICKNIIYSEWQYNMNILKLIFHLANFRVNFTCELLLNKYNVFPYFVHNSMHLLDKVSITKYVFPNETVYTYMLGGGICGQNTVFVLIDNRIRIPISVQLDKGVEEEQWKNFKAYYCSM